MNTKVHKKQLQIVMHFLPGLRQKFSEKRVPARRCHLGIGHQVPDSRFRTQDLNTNSKLDLRTNQKAAQILIIQRFDLLGQGVWERARRQLGKGDSALKPSNPGSGRSTYLYLYLLLHLHLYLLLYFSIWFVIVFDLIWFAFASYFYSPSPTGQPIHISTDAVCICIYNL